ncbi:MAG: smalltalk protein [Bacteroidales bacterium]|nr:smalltalk protein [Candidatus Minthousia equi]
MKRETIKWVIQLIISIASAVATAFGVSSCMR